MTAAGGMAWANECWFLTGPTAGGKSAVAIEVAQKLDAEILALDSMTLYRGMDVGTAKPSAEDRLKVPHHLLDLLDPSESSSVAWYLKQAEAAAREVLGRGKKPLFVGGTPLYLKACLRGLFDGPPADPAFRAELEHDAKESGTPALHARLAAIDPLAASRILPGDLRRIVRALEVHRATGVPISDLQRQFETPADPAPKVACIVRPRLELRARIAERVYAMLASGWIDEVERLWNRKPGPGREARQAVGYFEISEHLAGNLDAAQMHEQIVIRTRQFSKRQMTWFRHIAECRLVETSDAEEQSALAERVCRLLTARF
jgi:tRNA dimethylallyltransferase